MAASACMDAIESAYVLFALLGIFAATPIAESQQLSSDDVRPQDGEKANVTQLLLLNATPLHGMTASNIVNKQ